MKKKKNPLIIFIHIERSGGTTLNHSMKNNFPGVFAPVIKSYINQKDQDVPNYDYTLDDFKELRLLYPWVRFIGGHHTRAYVQYDEVVARDAFYMTFLRNPVDRYLSHFNFQRISMGFDWELDEFLSNPRFNNWQTFRIAGCYDLNKAKEILQDRINFVGITERYNESLVLMKHFLGVHNFRIDYPLLNSIEEKSNPNSIEIIKYSKLDDFHKRIVEENNQMDIELYDFACKIIYPKYLITISSKELEIGRKQLEKANLAFNENRIHFVMNKLSRKYINASLSKHAYKY